MRCGWFMIDAGTVVVVQKGQDCTEKGRKGHFFVQFIAQVILLLIVTGQQTGKEWQREMALGSERTRGQN